MPEWFWIINTTPSQFPGPSTRIINAIYGEKPLIGVEIGTGVGENALNLLQELNIERLYCIDPFTPYKDGDRTIQTVYSSRSEPTLENLTKFKSATFIRKFSSEAFKEIPKNVDFVYVDGDHGYDSVLADLKNYYPLVNKKGVIAGHDVTWSSVSEALTVFCRENTIKPFVLPPDWVIIKSM
jgi:predicted O-methyltransferase YrrM